MTRRLCWRQQSRILETRGTTRLVVVFIALIMGQYLSIWIISEPGTTGSGTSAIVAAEHPLADSKSQEIQRSVSPTASSGSMGPQNNEGSSSSSSSSSHATNTAATLYSSLTTVLSSQQQQPTVSLPTLGLYDPALHPVFPSNPPPLSTQQPRMLSVGLVSVNPLQGEAFHYLYDGVVQSDYMTLVGLVSFYGGGLSIDQNRDNMNTTTKTATNKAGGGQWMHPTNLTVHDADLWLVDGSVARLDRPLWRDLLRGGSQSSSSPARRPFQVLVVDFSDRFTFQLRHYRRLGLLVPPPNSSNDMGSISNHNNISFEKPTLKHVRLAVRSIVEGRQYDPKERTIQLGRIDIDLQRFTPGSLFSSGSGNNKDDTMVVPLPVLHFPYAVRSDIVVTLLKECCCNIRTKTNVELSPPDALYYDGQRRLEEHVFQTTPRTVDVLHLWQVTSKRGQSQLRNSVSLLVQSWNGTRLPLHQATSSNHSDVSRDSINNRSKGQGNGTPHNNSTTTPLRRTIRTSTDEQGLRKEVGRSLVDPKYVRAMMSAKIVIVAQRDGWEDHYRLFETLACGPLVISDRMLAPPKGLVHGQSILFFESLQELTALVSYYLVHEEERQEIAHQGWRVAMGQHRSWHRLEEVVFGRPLTRVFS
jgi:hypothetical protein